MAYKAEIPYGAYWSTPFARWQGAFANLHALEFAAHTARKELDRRCIPAAAIEHGVLGFSVPQVHSFYGLPWVAGRAGLGQVISAPRPTRPPATGKPPATSSRMVIAAVCQPLATSPSNSVALAAPASR